MPCRRAPPGTRRRRRGGWRCLRGRDRARSCRSSRRHAVHEQVGLHLGRACPDFRHDLVAEEFLGGEDEGAAPAVLGGRGGQGVGGMCLVPLGSPKGADPFLQPWADPALALALVRGGGASSPLRVRATQVGGGQLVLDPGDLAVEDRRSWRPSSAVGMSSRWMARPSISRTSIPTRPRVGGMRPIAFMPAPPPGSRRHRARPCRTEPRRAAIRCRSRPPDRGHRDPARRRSR
jgi:hypothetical protein